MMNDERRSLTPWAIRDRLQRRVDARKGAKLTYETTFVVLEAIRAYIANPRRDKIAAVICTRYNSRHEPCQPICRRCSDLAWELKQLFRGEVNPFGSSDWDSDPRRGKSKGDTGPTMGEHAARMKAAIARDAMGGAQDDVEPG